MSKIGRFDRAIQELQEFQEVADFKEILRSREASRLTKELLVAMNGLRMGDAYTQEKITALYTQLFQVIEEFTGKLTYAGKLKIYGMFLNAGGIQDVLDKFQIFCKELMQRQMTNLEATKLGITVGINKSVADLDIPE